MPVTKVITPVIIYTIHRNNTGLTNRTDSKIDLLDSPEVVAKKIKKATSAPQVVEENGVLAFVEFVLLPASGLKDGKRRFTVDRERDGLEPLVYDNITKMQDDYRNDVVRLGPHPVRTRRS